MDEPNGKLMANVNFLLSQSIVQMLLYTMSIETNILQGDISCVNCLYYYLCFWLLYY